MGQRAGSGLCGERVGSAGKETGLRAAGTVAQQVFAQLLTVSPLVPAPPAAIRGLASGVESISFCKQDLPAHGTNVDMNRAQTPDSVTGALKPIYNPTFSDATLF